ncbi:MAG TPA: methyltransferase domain-containing protein [Kofleriaceae bacterium]|jgi:SAM-dependent methyltransferase|nr:methyltransferase domain-containing protein [Kofleriaceae bacterium]
MTTTAPQFAGSIPETYETYFAPVLFEPYSRELARRIPPEATRILEIAAGTGRLSRRLLDNMPARTELVVTDLHQPMLDVASSRIHDSRARFQQADMLELPFIDGTFDAVFCQFGLMFAPDKPLAMREMHRVLRPGGTLVVAVWDTLANNPASELLHRMAFALMPDDPPVFMARPFSMADSQELLALAQDFASAHVDTVMLPGVSESASHFATGLVRGNPLYNQLVERRIDADAFQAQVAAALASEFGDSPCKSQLSAHILTAVA